MKLHDDGFYITAAEPWLKGKVSVIQQYLVAYAGTIATKVDELIFVDLYAGSGLYSLGEGEDVFMSASLMALSQNMPISKFILCEQDDEKLRALKVRTNKFFKHKNVLLLDGRKDDLPSRLEMFIPKSKRGARVAVFCLVDPFSVDFNFEIARQFANHEFDLLVPFTFALNDKLDYQYYLNEESEMLARFTGNTNLNNLTQEADNNTLFYKRLVQVFESNMLALGYNSSLSTHRLDSGLMELPTYQIGFFSKKFSMQAIQQHVDATRHVQFDLFQ